MDCSKLALLGFAQVLYSSERARSSVSSIISVTTPKISLASAAEPMLPTNVRALSAPLSVGISPKGGEAGNARKT